MIEDFKRGAIWTGSHRRRLGGARQDKGFAAQFAYIADVVRGAAEPPDPQSVFLSTLTTLAAAKSLESGTAEGVVLRPEAPDATPSPAGSR